MLELMWDSKSAMMAQQDKLDTISNNLANANTNGYKEISTNFKDLVYETLNRKGYPVSARTAGKTTLQTGTGVRAGEWTRDNTQGQLTQSEPSNRFSYRWYWVFRSNSARW